MKTYTSLLLAAALASALCCACATGDDPCENNPCIAPPDPCDPNPCDAPPTDTCENTTAVTYLAAGVCTPATPDPTCDYPESTRIDCALTDEICEAGACVAPDPCLTNPCTDSPPDTCTLDTAVQYPSSGICTNNGGSPSCDYQPTNVDCTLTTQVCQTGLCVTLGDPCAPNPCTNPPVDSCTNDTAVSYNALGACVDNGGQADCTYTSTDIDCTLDGMVCQAGLCVVSGDPCTPNPCLSPPVDTCTADVAQRHASTGNCTPNGGNHSCAYPVTPVDCAATGQVCSGAGLCVDPCNPNPCTSPPADDCFGNTLVEYRNPGICMPSGGNLSCAYPSLHTDCSALAAICSSGACVFGP